MRLIDKIRGVGGDIYDFRSYTGGLVAPESDDNPWHYKITWNPSNVVRAGQGTTQYLEQKQPRFVPSHRVFLNPKAVHVQDLGTLEMYPNRNSLQYQQAYGLDQVSHMMRGTLRYPGFCSAWNALIKIGLTDTHSIIHNASELTYRKLLEGFLPAGNGPLKNRLAEYLEISVNDDLMHKIEWLGLLSSTSINLNAASPGEILLQQLLKKWEMKKGDRDLVVMQHEIRYRTDHKDQCKISSMIYRGKDSKITAMSQLVGWPLGITAMLMMTGKLDYPGIHRPTWAELYEPVLDGLKQLGIKFSDTDGDQRSW